MRRRQIEAFGIDEILTQVTAAISAAGAVSFEISYDATNRRLAADEEATTADDVRWTASADFPTPFGGLRTLKGTALIKAGESHARGITWACARLLREGGATVRICDIDAGQEPPR